MTSNNTPAVQNGELMPTPTTSEDGLELLQRQADAMSAAHKLATVLCNTAMVPTSFRGKPDDGAAAILYGAELGLQPQQALQQVFVVHGQPAIYARTMVALLKAKGYLFETVESTDQSVTVTGTAPSGEQETATWTIARAEKAGYTRNTKYKTDPQAMLYAKAASEVCRRLAPDVLLGIRYTAEDLELEPAPVRARARRADRPATRPLAERLSAPGGQEPAEAVDVDAMAEEAASADSMEALTAVHDRARTALGAGTLTQDEFEDLRTVLNARAEDLRTTADETTGEEA